MTYLNCFKWIFLCAGAFMLSVVNAQNRAPVGASPVDQESFIRAVDSAIYVIRVDYVLSLYEDGKRQDFGQGSRDYYGREYGVAVAAGGKLWFDTRLLEPWIYFDQQNYSRYSSDTTLIPRVSRIAIRHGKGRLFTEYDQNLEETLAALDRKVPVSSLTMNTPLHEIGIVGNTRDTAAMLVTVTPRERFAADEGTPLQLAVHHSRVSYDANTSEGTIRTPSLLTKTIGGASFTLEPAFGRINVYFSGIIKIHPLKWSVLPLPYIPPVQPASIEELTPINKTSPKGGATVKDIGDKDKNADKDKKGKKKENGSSKNQNER